MGQEKKDFEEIKEIEKELFKLTNDNFHISSYDNSTIICVPKAKSLLIRYFILNDKYYNDWDFSSLGTYKKTFDWNFSKYKERYIDADLKDFARHERIRLEKLISEDPENYPFINFDLTLDNDPYVYIGFAIRIEQNDLLEPILLSHKKKIEFLNSEDIFETREEEIRLSSSSIPDYDLESIGQQVLLLHRLGVLNHLKEKYPQALQSNNQLAKVVAKFLGENHSTIQKVVNALMNDNSADDSYPKKTELVDSLISKLNALESN